MERPPNCALPPSLRGLDSTKPLRRQAVGRRVSGGPTAPRSSQRDAGTSSSAVFTFDCCDGHRNLAREDRSWGPSRFLRTVAHNSVWSCTRNGTAGRVGYLKRIDGPSTASSPRSDGLMSRMIGPAPCPRVRRTNLRVMGAPSACVGWRATSHRALESARESCPRRAHTMTSDPSSSSGHRGDERRRTKWRQRRPREPARPRAPMRVGGQPPRIDGPRAGPYTLARAPHARRTRGCRHGADLRVGAAAARACVRRSRPRGPPARCRRAPAPARRACASRQARARSRGRDRGV